ncbi:MAG: SH3 domain-containing protein [Bryobacteraceae bacterium]|nr:SH3 domain-containing protein [Bryobacteraceae bacterium]
MGLLAVAPAAALMMSHVVLQDRLPLREGCGPDERVVAFLSRGDPVAIQFAVAGEGGTCYKVNAAAGGRTGYVSAAAVSGVEQFERERRAAPAIAFRAETAVVRTAAMSPAAGPAGPRAAMLIERNRPAEALEALEAALRTNGSDPGLLSLAGYAAYRGDDMARAMDYWRKSLALQPNPAVERLYLAAEREAREDTSGEKLIGARFVLRYPRGRMEPAAARALSGRLDQEFARISAELGCEASERIVAIVQSPEEYRRTTEAAEWSAGQFNGRIRVADFGSGEAERTFSHEIVHACLAAMGDFPQWLHEGLAQKLSGRTLSEAELGALKRQARAGGLPRLGNLSQTWSRLSASHAAMAYNAALAATELFYQRHAAIGPRNLLRDPRLIPQIAADLDRALRE